MQNIWRLLIPGLAFQAVLIGGGYATGRELISFYFSSGPLGGLIAMTITAVIWSLTMMVVLEISRRYEAYDYKTFFQKLIGPGWIAFELAYIALLIVVLSIVGAAAGEITAEMSALPKLVGTIALIAASAVILLFGNEAVKRVLSYWSVVLYIGYISFFILFMSKLGHLTLASFSQPIGGEVILNGLKYAGVNINCFASILFLAAMLRTRNGAFVSGALVGPVAIIPGMLFYAAMMAYYPAIQEETVPLNFLLAQLDIPIFKIIFQVAILGTLLQTGVGMLHAFNERIDAAYEKRERHMPHWLRGVIGLSLLVFSITIAEWVGLVALIDKGYGLLSWVFIVLIFLPVFTIGVMLVFRRNTDDSLSAEKPA